MFSIYLPASNPKRGRSYEEPHDHVGRHSVRARHDGSGIDRRFVKAGDSPVGVAVDDRHIYSTHRFWHDNSRGVSFGYAIGRANLDGSGADKRFIEVSNQLDGTERGTVSP